VFGEQTDAGSLIQRYFFLSLTLGCSPFVKLDAGGSAILELLARQR
jgi:hypothetical protein